ncbi:MAG: NUDIX hydrolase [Gammaproteobacteria bacterium]|nr:NUDIX hydrolase [Gammaproteobacteria bacterium]
MRIFRGRIVEVEVDTVGLPDGGKIDLEIVRHPGGAAAVALDERMQVCLLRQYRPVIGDWLWELPAGKIDAGEPPLETARRELAEEAGLAAAHWQGLGHMISSPGVFTERVHLYLARGLSPVPATPQAGELFELHWIPLSEALAWARDGGIEDAKSVIALVRAAARLGLP